VRPELDKKSRRGAVFFDRDGTLNWSAALGEYIRSATDLKLLPGAAAAVGRVNAAGFPAILVTNQRWLSAPGADLDSYRQVEAELASQLVAEGVRLDASYTCPHAVSSCDCRKPLPGLLLRAAKDFGLNLRESFFVGDSVSDVQAGQAVGATSILISPGAAAEGGHLADCVVSNVEDAVDWILNPSRRRR
jgi:D-glycero-D-manno-heptose 1,7-bisphosphate phosphatase